MPTRANLCTHLVTSVENDKITLSLSSSSSPSSLRISLSDLYHHQGHLHRDSLSDLHHHQGHLHRDSLSDMHHHQGHLHRTSKTPISSSTLTAPSSQIRMLNNMDEDEVFAFSKSIAASYDLVAQTKQMGRLPVVQFASGGIVTPVDVGLMMQLGCDGVFVGSDVFGSADPYKHVRGMVDAVRNYNHLDVLVEASSGLAGMMAGMSLGEDRIEGFGHGGV